MKLQFRPVCTHHQCGTDQVDILDQSRIVVGFVSAEYSCCNRSAEFNFRSYVTGCNCIFRDRSAIPPVFARCITWSGGGNPCCRYHREKQKQFFHLPVSLNLVTSSG